jgi:hypothetical protein
MDNNNSETPENKSQPESPQPDGKPAYQDWHELRRAARQARHEARQQWREQRYEFRGMYGYGWFGGALLILLGIVFLLQNFYALPINNWWAIFILLPAFIAFNRAWHLYQPEGRLNWLVWRSFLSGLFFTLLTLVLLFNVDWGLFLPILLILFGITLLAGVMIPK